MTRLNLSLILLAIIFVASCQTATLTPQIAETREVRDDMGRTVKVPTNIERAVSLAPSLTEIIFAVGAGDRLVGVTTYCNFPQEAAGIPKVGDTQTPNIEKIIALKPQVVFVSTASQLEAFSKTLEEQGIAVYVTNPTTLPEVFENLKALGHLFDKSASAIAVAESLTERVKAIRSKTVGKAHAGQQRVFIQISNEPLFTVGRDSFLTELIEQAGGVSVTRDVPSGYPKISKETAAALDPEVIILSDSPDNLEPSNALKNSSAVRNSRVYRINADIISRPGPRLVDALEEMARILNTPN